MKKREKIILSLIENRRIIKWALIASAILMLIVASAVIFWLNHENKIETSVDERINITPTQIRQIENIGQWEFLSISDEEMIDTTRRGFFSDAQLVRIYYGTLRLGIDLKKTTPHWLRVEADTLLVATLPPIQLLDYNFIDEAQTKSIRKLEPIRPRKTLPKSPQNNAQTLPNPTKHSHSKRKRRTPIHTPPEFNGIQGHPNRMARITPKNITFATQTFQGLIGIDGKTKWYASMRSLVS